MKDVPFLVYALLLLFTSIISVELKDHLRWVFLTYHKTGTEISINFGYRLFRNRTQCSLVKVRGAHHTLNVIGRNHVMIPKPLPYIWSDVFKVQTLQFKVVHFVRDPFDMIMSGYLYHKQQPPPDMEPWLEHPEYDPCMWDNVTFTEMFIPAVNAFTKQRVDVSAMIKSVVKLCHQLKERYKEATFHKALIKARNADDLYDGIRWDACRAILDGAHGQVLTMAYNLLQERETRGNPDLSHVMVRRVLTPEFPVSNVEKFHHSTVQLFDFLTGNHSSNSGVEAPFYSCLGDTKDEMIENAMLVSFDTLPSKYSSTSSYFQEVARRRGVAPSSLGIPPEEDSKRHVTRDQMTEGDRRSYSERLEKDPVLGDLLKMVRAIVLDQEIYE